MIQKQEKRDNVDIPHLLFVVDAARITLLSHTATQLLWQIRIDMVLSSS